MVPKHRATDGTRTVKASEFKRGRPAARLVPLREPLEEAFGADRNAIRIHGDIVESLDAEWEAEVDPSRVVNP